MRFSCQGWERKEITEEKCARKEGEAYYKGQEGEARNRTREKKTKTN